MSDTLIPRIAVIGCGGTISSFGTSNLDVMDYPDEGRKLAVHEVLAHVPEVGQIARIVPVTFRDVSSTALTVEDWLRLRKVIRTLCSEQLDLAGIIILHGTGTLEETAFFLNLTLDVPQTVVVVGAQRPLNAVGSDAPMNVLNAARIAADPRSRGRGVLVALNDEIHSARDVVKSSTYRVQAFRSPDYGMLGQVDGDGVHFFRKVDRPHTSESPFAPVADEIALPRVDILYSYLGCDDVFIDAAIRAGAAGLVSAGFAPGLVTPSAKQALERLAAGGFPIVLCSRAYSGRVARRHRLMRHGMIAGEDFSPQKARILLSLCLASGFGIEDIRNSFAAI